MPAHPPLPCQPAPDLPDIRRKHPPSRLGTTPRQKLWPSPLAQPETETDNAPPAARQPRAMYLTPSRPKRHTRSPGRHIPIRTIPTVVVGTNTGYQRQALQGRSETTIPKPRPPEALIFSHSSICVFTRSCLIAGAAASRPLGKPPLRIDNRRSGCPFRVVLCMPSHRHVFARPVDVALVAIRERMPPVPASKVDVRRYFVRG